MTIQDFPGGWHRQATKESIFIWSDEWMEKKRKNLEKEKQEEKQEENESLRRYTTHHR